MTSLRPHLMALALLCWAGTAQAGKTERALYERAQGWLLARQHPNGAFGQIPGEPPGEAGITALAIKALLEAPEPFRARGRAPAEKAMAWLLTHQQKDGSFTQARSGLSTYRTALALSAMVALDRARYREQIERASKWLVQDQFDEGEGVGKNNPHYGGFGYDMGGQKPDADLSNTIMALGALKDAGLEPGHPVFQRALVFLSRCQNSSETNPGVGQLKPKDDGGFIYDPGLSRNKSAATKNEDGSTSFESYASMTYGGLLSLVYTGTSKDDARVKAALAWVRENYTLDENYGLGVRQKDPQASQQGLYYYYMVFAKCLAAVGAPTVKTRHGERRWAADLLKALAARQKPEGQFLNENDRWWEKDPVLVTAYVLNALNLAWPHLPDEGKQQ